jgi:SAM-dependent methyltransferase
MATERNYEGAELALFGKAVHWKAYWGRKILPFVKGRVLEVGAGLGGNAAGLSGRAGQTWTLLEPDRTMCEEIRAKVNDGRLPGDVAVVCGVLRDLPAEPTFDTILYIDVLEHIEDDRGELVEAMRRLRPDGHLIVLSPAYQFLFSPFDAAIGHHRRYDRRGLLAVAPREVRPLEAFYLDSVGLLLSLANRLVARQSMPTPATIRLWDTVIVRLSRLIDPILAFNAGRSVIAVWSKAAGA